MKKLVSLSVLVLFCLTSFSQVSVIKKEGGSVVTKLGIGLKVNEGSSLKRERIILNQANCPIQLNDIGVETSFEVSSFHFKSVGNFTTIEPVVAYEIVHIIYDVFGEHITSLSNPGITDIEGQKELKSGSWPTSEYNVTVYFICVSYVANVKTKNGTLWHFNYKEIKEQLDKLKISFEEGYFPKKVIQQEK
jgi:hypothetical protein